MENIDQSQNHRIGRIIQVQIARNPQPNLNIESRFRVQLRCACCLGRILIATRSQLISTYGLTEAKVVQIEQLSLRQQRLRETKQNSDELMSYLDFSDVTDFASTTEEQFVEFIQRESSIQTSKQTKNQLSKRLRQKRYNAVKTSTAILETLSSEQVEQPFYEEGNILLPQLNHKDTIEEELKNGVDCCDDLHEASENSNDMSSASPLIKTNLSKQEYESGLEMSLFKGGFHELSQFSRRKAKINDKSEKQSRRHLKKSTDINDQKTEKQKKLSDIFIISKIQRQPLDEIRETIVPKIQNQYKRSRY